MRASGHSAVMSQRVDPLDGLDDFPTQPWGARALEAHVLPAMGLSLSGRRVWEPAAGRGIMAAVFREARAEVITSDVHRYRDGAPLDLCGSFVGEGCDIAHVRDVDIIATNPPFSLALEFVLRGLAEARVAVAMLCRSNWAEGVERYERLFKPHPPAMIAQFVERLPMTAGATYQGEGGIRFQAHRGGYDPEASTATSYSWFVSRAGARGDNGFGDTRTIWIPPCRKQLERPDDARRFGKIRTAPAADLSTIKGSA